MVSRYGLNTYCRAFDKGTVIICFNDLDLLRLGYEQPTFRLRGERYTYCATTAV